MDLPDPATMVLCGVDEGKRASKILEKQISQWNKQYKKAMKILLLGAGESGKTTIIKQMKILHINGFSDEEKKEKANDIRNNILEGITTLVRMMPEFDIQLRDLNLAPSKDYISNIDKDNFEFNAEFFEHVERLWKDEGLQEIYSLQHKFQLIDCVKYFLDRVDKVKQDDYEPSIQDILHSRRRTTEIQKIEFEIQVPKKYGGGSLAFWMFDVGGQRGERKKWIQVFDGIQAVLFLVSASCFDLVIREDDETNRLQESIDIFKSVWHSRFLKNSGFIVFLNKQDILKEKVVDKGKNIGDYFPDFAAYQLQPKDKDSQDNEDYIKTRCFIRDKFLEISKEVVQREARILAPGFKSLPTMPDNEPPRDCYTHFTTATDTNNVRLVFEDVHNMIVMWNLRQMGLDLS